MASRKGRGRSTLEYKWWSSHPSCDRIGFQIHGIGHALWFQACIQRKISRGKGQKSVLLYWYVHYKSQWRVGSLEGGKGRWSVDRSSRNRMLFLSTEHIAHVLWLQVRIQRRTFTATITIRKGILWGQNFIFIYTTSLHCNNARSIFERFSDRENHGDFWIHFQSSCTLTLVEGGFSYSYKTSSK